MNLRLCIIVLCALGLLLVIISLFPRGTVGKYQMIIDHGSAKGVLILNTQNSQLMACRFSPQYFYSFSFSGSECINLDVIKRVKETKEWRIEKETRMKEWQEEENKKTPEQKEKELMDFLKERRSGSP